MEMIAPHIHTQHTHTHTDFLDVFFPLRTYPWSSIQQQHFYHLHSSSSPAIQLSILICISFNLHWCVSVSQDVLMGFDKDILFRLSFLPFFDRKVTQRFTYVYICIYAFIFINLSSGNVAQSYHSLFGVWFGCCDLSTFGVFFFGAVLKQQCLSQNYREWSPCLFTTE